MSTAHLKCAVHVAHTSCGTRQIFHGSDHEVWPIVKIANAMPRGIATTTPHTT